ncbi:MAG TPA: GNAT family N-acetyltransferase [Tepidisphaeraceae bacterium]
MITVRRITERDAELLREIRLRALSNSPTAFGSTFAGEAALAAEEWQKRARDRSHSENDVNFFAFDGDVGCGIIGCYRQADEPGKATIVSMWVLPQARRKGVGMRLIQAVEQWARRLGLSHLLLDVVNNNAAAIAFYQKLGFRFTGESGPYPNNPNLRELFMLKTM